MIAVLIDCENKIINECFGVHSCLELPLFTETFGNKVLKNISGANADKIYVYSKIVNSFKNYTDCEVEFIDDLRDIQCVFSQKPNDFTSFFFSNIYFENEEDFYKLTENKYADVFSVNNQTGDRISVILRNSKVYEFLSDNNFDIKELTFETAEKIIVDCYSKIINKPTDYKNLISDILAGNTSFHLPEVAQGVFAESKIPKGDFVIVPPVFFDEGVQVESGCVIGPCTAIMKNCLIAKNSNIRNSVISKNCYISSGCFLDNIMCAENVSVRRNSVVFSDTVLGHDSALGEDSVIENGSYIRPFAKIDDFKKNYINFKQESNQSPAGFYGYTPEKAALLGAAVGIVFNSPKIAVASDGELNSTALKLSLLGGLITTGASCYDFGNTFLSSLHYYMSFCELDCAVFISGNREGTAITVFYKNTYSLSNSDYYNIKNVMTSGEIRRCDSGECKNIRQIHGMQRMYVQNLIKKFDNELEFVPVFECENKRIKSVLEIAVSKIGFKAGKNCVIFKINYEGTKITAESNGIHFSHGKLLEIVSHFVTEKGDLYLKNVSGSSEELWKLDALILCFKLLETLKNNKVTLYEAYKKLPAFYVAESTVLSKVPLSALASEISNKNCVNYDKGELRYQDGLSKVRINKMSDGSLKIAARAVTIEAAREIVGNLTEIISRY